MITFMVFLSKVISYSHGFTVGHKWVPSADRVGSGHRSKSGEVCRVVSGPGTSTAGRVRLGSINVTRVQPCMDFCDSKILIEQSWSIFRLFIYLRSRYIAETGKFLIKFLTQIQK